MDGTLSARGSELPIQTMESQARYKKLISNIRIPSSADVQKTTPHTMPSNHPSCCPRLRHRQKAPKPKVEPQLPSTPHHTTAGPSVAVSLSSAAPGARKWRMRLFPPHSLLVPRPSDAVHPPEPKSSCEAVGRHPAANCRLLDLEAPPSISPHSWLGWAPVFMGEGDPRVPVASASFL